MKIRWRKCQQMSANVIVCIKKLPKEYALMIVKCSFIGIAGHGAISGIAGLFGKFPKQDRCK